jgi:hypothetical protein
MRGVTSETDQRIRELARKWSGIFAMLAYVPGDIEAKELIQSLEKAAAELRAEMEVAK